MKRYEEFPAPPGLGGLVDCLWRSEAPAAPAGAGLRAPVAHRVLPDNCTDILWQDSGEAFFVGMMSTWFDVPAARRVRTVAVRFRPGAAGLFLGGLPLASLTDGRADLDVLWGRSDADRLGDALWSVARSDAERLALLAQALYARLAAASPGARAATALAARAVAELEAAGGALRVEQLAQGLGVSRQHLAGQFRDHVGLSPKLFARICRFRAARAAALAGGGPDWAALALDCGYFDQSHLIRDFHDFSGTSPDAYLGKR